MLSSKRPITLADIFAANFQPMTQSDLSAFQGIEGDGYIARCADKDEFLFVMDMKKELNGGEIKIEVYGHYEEENNSLVQVFEINVKERAL